MAYEAGAYPGSPIGAGAMCIFACYDVPNGRIDGYDVVVNKPQTSAYRAPGAPVVKVFSSIDMDTFEAVPVATAGLA